jgi:xanthine dehydrogenase accessory factor
MLISSDGEYAGLLSGGCLEGDLREHARDVMASGTARIVRYDLRSTDDGLLGLGAGCEGAMDILLTRHGPGQGDWQPLDSMEEAHRAGRPLRLGFITASSHPRLPLGSSFPADGVLPDFVRRDSQLGALLGALHEAALHVADNDTGRVDSLGLELFVATLAPPPRVLLLGGGPDARPVATLATFLGWRLTVVDHRAAYLDAARFPAGVTLVETRAEQVADAVALDEFAAAVVMSHQLDSDLHYLRALAHCAVPYVGLLGPAARREKLLADLGDAAPALRARLRAPVGLDIGGRTPEVIALSIVGEVQAVLAGRGGRPFSETSESGVSVSTSGHAR